MSNIEYTPYYEFVPNQVLKASDLNNMQKRIAEEIQEAQSNGASNALGGASVMIEYDFATQGVPTTTFDVLVMGTPYMSFYKISDLTPTREELEGAFFYSNYQGNKNLHDPFVLTKDMIMFENENIVGYGTYYHKGGEYAIGIAYSAGTSIVTFEDMELEITIPEAGIYLPFDGAIENIPWYSSLTYFNGTQVDWNQNDKFAANYIKNRPCYSKELEFKEEKILENVTISTFTAVTIAGKEVYKASLPAFSNPIFMTNNYRVVVNGNEHLLYCASPAYYNVDGSRYPAFHEDGVDPSWILGDQTVGGVVDNLINAGLGFAIVGSDELPLLFTANNSPLTLSIFTSNIIIPNGTYEFFNLEEGGIPMYGLLPQTLDTPFARLEPNNEWDYLITFDGKQYKCPMTLDGPSVLGMGQFQGVGNPLDIFMGNSDLPFVIIDYISMMQKILVLELIYSKEAFGVSLDDIKLLSPMLAFELLQDSIYPPIIFLIPDPGSHEIEVLKIPRENVAVSLDLLPEQGKSWNLINNTNKKYVKNLPFGKEFFAESKNSPMCTGVATYMDTTNSVYAYIVTLDSPINPAELKERYLLTLENGFSQEMPLPSLDLPIMGNIDVLFQSIGIPSSNQELNSNPLALTFVDSSTLTLFSVIDLGPSLQLSAFEMSPVIAQIPKELLPTTLEGNSLILPEFGSEDEGKTLKIVGGVPTWV